MKKKTHKNIHYIYFYFNTGLSIRLKNNLYVFQPAFELLKSLSICMKLTSMFHVIRNL